MKRVFSLMLVVVMLFSVNAGCSRTQKVVVMQAEVSEPYETIGKIEVDRSVPRIQYRRVFGQLWEWMTFGHSDNLSSEAYLKGLLDEKMLRSAKKDYKAEAIIHAEYWPDLSAKKFPQGRIYAKGDMIRYKRFPE